MKKIWIAGFLVGWICWAQGPMRLPAPGDAAADLQGQAEWPALHPEAGWMLSRPSPIYVPAPAQTDRPDAQTISVEQLRHKVPNKARNSFQRAQKLAKAGKHEQAAAELEAALRLDPEFVQAYDRLAGEYRELRRFPEAEALLQKVLKLVPDSWTAHYDLGLIQLAAGNLDASEQSARRALRLSGDNAWVHMLLGYVLYLRHDTRDEGLQEVRYAARTLKEAREFLRDSEKK